MKKITHHALKSLFSGALQTVLGVSACAAQSTKEVPGAALQPVRPKAPPLTCDGEKWQPLTGLHTLKPVDYMRFGADMWSSTPYVLHVSEERGEPCKNAKNRQSCLAAFGDRFAPVNDFGLTVTDETGLNRYTGIASSELGNIEPLKKLLGEFDTADEIAMAAYIYGFDFKCDASTVTEVEGGYQLKVFVRPDHCGNPTVPSLIFMGYDGSLKYYPGQPEYIGFVCGFGRAPAGLQVPEVQGSGLGDFLAECAFLEAASVPAFHILARDLKALDAPQELIDFALRSAQEEERHTSLMTALSHRYGACVEKPIIEETAPKTLFELAAENRREGCVRETISALLASYQAKATTDQDIAQVMDEISQDEERHALLAWKIAAWIEPKLTPHQQDKLLHIQQDAVRALKKELASPRHQDVHQIAGWPAPAQALQLVASIEQSLWGVVSVGSAVG